MSLPAGLFITGTDTGVGKSEVTAALAARLVSEGITVFPRKPAESGCLPNTLGEPLLPQDGYQLQQASGNREPLVTITPYRFEPALSPERAAQLAQTPLSLQQLVEACRAPQQRGAITLVEGAGGFYSPIASDALNADLATALDLPVVLVSAERLGVINQVLLAHEAILKRGLKLAAVVLNRANESDHEGNHAAIQARIEAPLLTLPQSETTPPWQALQQKITPLIAALKPL